MEDIKKIKMSSTNDYKLHYVVVFYIGPNRNYTSYQHLFKTDPLMMFRRHVDFLKTADNNLKSATFIFNQDLDPTIRQELENFKDYPLPVTIGYYNGPGFSYGAWNEVIKKRMDNYDYLFLIEDDYIPTRPDFYKPFVDRCNDEYPYVCTYVEERSPGQFVASSSNAIIKAKQCKEIFSKYGEVFTALNSNSLQEAWNTQINFLNFFFNEGYKIRDILDEYQTPHMLNCNINHLVTFGNQNAPILIEPIIVPLIQ